MFAPDTLIIVILTFLLAGLVKGVIGLGLPTVSLALLTATLGLKPAMALLLVPSFITNVWQGLVGGALLELSRRLWLLLIAVCVSTWFGAKVLAVTDTALLSALLGGLLCLYATLSLRSFHMPSPGRFEPWVSPVIGVINGVLTGMTGSFVFPGVPYLQALGLTRDQLIQAMGILFSISTVALALSMNEHKLISSDLGLLSAAGVIPALAGMVLGQKLRQRLSETAFRKVFFGAILVLGIYIIIRSFI